FLVREAAPTGEVTVVGTNGALWTALYDLEQTWSANPVLDDADRAVYAEQPELEHLGSEALLVFRRFGDTRPNAGLGQISLIQLQALDAPSPPLDLTDAPAQQWLPALAINPVNGQAVVLHTTLT